MFILPLSYLFCYEFGLYKLIGLKSSLFCNVFTIISFVRYVILPPYTVAVSYYLDSSLYIPTNNERTIATALMAYELITITMIICLIYSKNDTSRLDELFSRNTVLFEEWHISLVGVFLIILCLSVVSSGVIEQFNFITPSSYNTVRYNRNYEYYEQTSSTVKLLAIVLNVAISLVFVNLAIQFAIKYSKNKDKIYYFFSLLMALLNITVYQGSNRSAMLIKGLSTLIILLILFKKERKYLIIGILLVIFILLSSISVSRNHNIFDSIQSITTTLNAYLAGPENVAISLHIKELAMGESRIDHLIYDICRPVIGLGSLIKQSDFNTTSELYNRLIYGTAEGASILPFIGQGYYYFGFIFSPLLEVLFINVAHYIEKKSKHTNNLLDVYFLSFISIRMGFFMAQNLYIQINSLFSVFIISQFFIYINHLFVGKRKEYVIN